MRVVLDTGVLIAALITSGTPPDRVYQAWRKRRFQLVTSEWQITEFRRVSRYPKLRDYLKPSEAGTLINSLHHQAIVLKRLPRIDISSDPDDNPVLAMALAGQANFLVTGDKQGLLALKVVGNVRVITAREFLKVLEKYR